jgi:hypothetical protein
MKESEHLYVISLADVLSQIVGPAVADVFEDGEVSMIAVKFDPDLAEGSITVSLTAVGEEFYDLAVQGDVGGYDVAEWRDRLRSDMADWVAESQFGWGQNRGV